MDIFSGLNDKQKEAVVHKEGPLLIVAGAGAGKTKTITHRIVNLVQSGVAPHEILAVTFTNKAAKEMRERVISLLDESDLVRGPEKLFDKPFVSTFHSLGVHILRENGRHIGLPKNFTILDQNDTLATVKEAIRNRDFDPKLYEPRKIHNIISTQKNNMTSLEDLAGTAGGNYLQGVVVQIWREYERILTEQKALDFDDLIQKTVLLLQNHADVRTYYQNKWKYIHIDEYQDTNTVQYELTKLLASAHQNLCVVGDTDQNIYSWRGADIKNMLRFERDYQGTTVVMLEQNYRSTKTILSAANQVIKKNKYRVDKNLFTENGEGESISLFDAMDEENEADFIARESKDIIKNGAQPSDIAILYRANFQSRVLEAAFLKYGVPYQVLGVKFFERKEVKDLLSYIRAALNPESLCDIKRIINTPTRGIGKVTLAKMFAHQEDGLPSGTRQKIADFHKILSDIKNYSEQNTVSETMKFAMKKSGLEDSLTNSTEEDLERLENLKELVTLAKKYDELPKDEALEKLLTDAALASDQDSLEKPTDAVKLMTVHAAKGLEFPYVFVTGLEQNLFPHQGFGERLSKEDQEEERRLFYVAITRAKKKLYLSYAAMRTIFGSKQMNMPSEFLSDIDDSLFKLVREDRIDDINQDIMRTPGKIVYLDF
jgi:DNA helicase-2/ATP-dependent DNA helicase PcrA